MAQPSKMALVRLEEISTVLGVSVDQFMTNAIPSNLSAHDEYLRLWSLLKTDTARQRALAALRRVVDEEAA